MIREPKTERKIFGFLILTLFSFFASGFSLKMEFSSQAPEGNWNEPWYNDCEEVSIAMVDSFYNNRKLTSAIAKKEILRIMAIKEKAYGSSLNENAEKMADLINNFLNWKARVVENPTIEQIKEQIDNNHPVILPADGRKLNNRYYTTTEYHVIVISGYDDDGKMFITQDAGTYRGHDYKYSYEIIENAMHDYNPEDLSAGRRVAIFTSPKTEEKSEEKKDAPKIVASLTPFQADESTSSSEEIKKDNLPTTSQKNTESDSVLKMINNWRNNLIEWVKRIFYWTIV